MTKFLTAAEITRSNKYKKLCEGFGVDPVIDYEEILFGREYEEETKENKNKKEALEVYLKQCKAIGVKPARNLETTDKIWDYILRDVNVAVDKELGYMLSKITNVILRTKIKIVLRTLYDELIIVKKSDVEELFKCANDNDELEKAYRKLGGTTFLAISNITTAEEEEEEDYDEDYEDD